jgi:isopropylmalate/homocitrate/citramalate synthase
MDNGGDRKVWVSALNDRAKIAPNAARTGPVRFYDTTLRDGEQTVGVDLDRDQKVETAFLLDSLGVGRIEAGFPRTSAEDAEAFGAICRAGLRAEIWGFARAVIEDVDEVIRLGAHASVIEIPASEIKQRAYGITADEAIRRAAEAVRHAVKHGLTVAFFAVDGTRADVDHLRRLYLAAMEAGAKEAVIVDTIGACGPEGVGYLVGQVREWLGASVPLHYHGHNDFGLATACAVAAVRAGATWIQGTINGMGERAGNADLGEVAMALECIYGVETELKLDKIREVSQFVRRVSGYELEPWKPVVGENLFMRESGAVATQFHIPEAIEPFSADIVRARREIVLGKKSGLDSIAIKSRDLGLNVTESQRGAVLAAVKKMGMKKRGLITDDEFRAIVTEICPH